ncbi:MAG: HD domain-containing phosphohydrolase [Cetobacterium sp.]
MNIFSIQMSDKEKKWLNDNKNRVVNIDIYNPHNIYFFQKEDEELGGVYVDLFKKITNETGLKFNIRVQSLYEIRTILKRGIGEIVFNSTITPERERTYYYISTLKNKYIPESDIPASSYWMSINKKEPDLHSIIKKFKESFRTNELRSSFKKERPLYYKMLLKDDKRLLNLQKKYNFIKVLLPPSGDMLPLFYKTNRGYNGYVIDRLKELAFILDVPLIYTRNQNDTYDIKAIDSDVFINKNSTLYIPYYQIGVAIFSNIDHNFIDSSKEILNQKVGFVASDDLNPELLKYIPKFQKYIMYRDSDKALKGILKGEIDYLYGDFKILSMAIENRYLSNRIKVSGFLGGSETIGFNINNDSELFQIFKIIFPTQLVETSILEGDLKISRKLNPDYKYFLIVSSILLGIIALLLYLLKKVRIAELKEKRITRALVHSFEAANELNDEDTGNHILRVSLYSKFLAEKLKCSSDFIKEVGEYASLHDVGKIAISDTILKKPGKLTFEEFEEMKLHVIYGNELVQKMELGSVAQNIVLYHHERWNGKGYCHKLVGKHIPLEARIVALADVYDALRQARVYKDGFSHRKSIEIIIGESGEHFDPRIVNIFLEFNEEFDKIFKKN